MTQIVWLTQTSPVYAQTPLDDIRPEAYFDFWLGTWSLTWEDADGTLGGGSNKIKRILNQMVIKENFEALTGTLQGFTGKSYSVYNTGTGEWKQTWVDNNGGYLDFTGEFDSNRRIFRRKGMNPAGRNLLQRMVFYDITDQSFTWDWEVSEDNGESWQLRWRIYYERVD